MEHPLAMGWVRLSDLSIPLFRQRKASLPPGPPAPYLHPGLGQLCAQRQLLAGKHVGVMSLLEDLFQLLQLKGAEGRPVPPLLALAPTQRRGLWQQGAAQGGGCQQWGFGRGAAGSGHCVALGLAAFLDAWRGEVGG